VLVLIREYPDPLDNTGVGLLSLPQSVSRKVDVRLPGKGHSNSHGARPVHQIIYWFESTVPSGHEPPVE